MNSLREDICIYAQLTFGDIKVEHTATSEAPFSQMLSVPKVIIDLESQIVD